MNITIPENVKYIIRTLEKHGHEAYAVGGCVRDSLLLREPQDWDITTSARPEEVKALFRRTVDTGFQHGTVTVMLDRTGYEVTTYRIDGAYTDSRHPESVTFTPELSEDLRRRDFTINAMAYNEKEGLRDLFGGQEDLDGKVIRAVGDPVARFTEDALRIMRCVRFAAQLGFQIDERTYIAAKALSGNLKNISRERVREELLKVILSDHPDYLLVLEDVGALKGVFPEFRMMVDRYQNSPFHEQTVAAHTIRVIKQLPTDRVLRLTALFHDSGKVYTHVKDENGRDHFYGHAAKSVEIAGRIMEELKFDNDTRTRVCHLIRYHDLQVSPNEKSVRKAMNIIGKEDFPMLLTFAEADNRAKSTIAVARAVEKVSQLRGIYEKILERGDCVSLKELAVTGRDLIEEGMKPGKEMGDVLNSLLSLVLEDPEMNDREKLLSLVREKFVK